MNEDNEITREIVEKTGGGSFLPSGNLVVLTEDDELALNEKDLFEKLGMHPFQSIDLDMFANKEEHDDAVAAIRYEWAMVLYKIRILRFIREGTSLEVGKRDAMMLAILQTRVFLVDNNAAGYKALLRQLMDALLIFQQELKSLSVAQQIKFLVYYSG